MNFRTTIKQPVAAFSINHRTKITCLGSCFAEHIGNKLRLHKMDVLCNPTGIMYNPVSLKNTILSALENRTINPNSLFQQQDRWVHYDFHSGLSTLDPKETSQLLNREIQNLHSQLVQSDVLILSFGTAFVFKLLKTEEVVNNCHKMPSKLFKRQLLTIDDILDNLKTAFESLIKINPKINILLTLSPVRHIRDGLVANNRSKALLNVAIHQLVDSFDNIFYFPAYEILLDDLRDYRFFNQDLVHPSEQSVDYIWNTFCQVFFSDQTKGINKQLSSIRNATKHKPFNPNSNQHRIFKDNQKQKILSLLTKHSYLDLTKELAFFD